MSPSWSRVWINLNDFFVTSRWCSLATFLPKTVSNINKIWIFNLQTTDFHSILSTSLTLCEILPCSVGEAPKQRSIVLVQFHYLSIDLPFEILNLINSFFLVGLEIICFRRTVEPSNSLHYAVILVDPLSEIKVYPWCSMVLPSPGRESVLAIMN